MINLLFSFFKKNYLVIFITLIFSVLLLRNPYSTRTLIPNLEPFPDALYYTTTPLCFLNGQQWKMCRINNDQIEGIKTVVPPAYSLTLLPAYVINSDVRSFYFANLFLSFLALFLLYKVANNFFKNKYITSLILFLYVTNYYVYWFPTLAMAENLLIPIFLSSVLLLQQKKSTIKLSIAAGVISASFYATKFAFAPLTIVFPIIYLIKIWTNEKSKDIKIKQSLAAAIPGGIILMSLVGITELINVLNQIFNGYFDSSSSEIITTGGSYFSMSYFSDHIQGYSDSLVGKPQKFLWSLKPLTEQWIALPALFGLVASFKHSNFRLTKVWLIVSAVVQLLFMSTFYVVDIRYVFHFLPIILLGFGFFLLDMQKYTFKKKYLFNVFLFIVFLLYLIPSLIRLKSVVAVNLKYSETPWWYLSQIEMNTYFDNLVSSESYLGIEDKPILITLSAPYLSDNYSNQNYTSLPLNNQQDFKSNMSEVWGENDYSDLLELYSSKVSSGKSTYITNYGVSAAGHFKESYKNVQDNFTLVEVQTGCYNLCNIYKLEIKE
jgi:hypothetical protein